MSLSNNMLRAVNMPETGEVFVPIIEIDHADLASPERFVADTQALTHGGNTYSPLAFTVQLPDDEDEGMPVLRWTADATDQKIVQILRSVTGAVDVEVKWVLVSSPNTVEAGPFNVQMSMAEYDAMTAGGPMTIDPILDEAFSKLTITPSTYPAEF